MSTEKKRKDAAKPSQHMSSPRKKARQHTEIPPVAKSPLLAPHDEILGELSPKYNVLTFSVISSTQIHNRVTSITSHLTTEPSSIVFLHARPATVCKLITIVELVKRILREQGKTCFQYNQLFDFPLEPKQTDIVEKTVLEGDARASDDEDDEDDFEVMESRLEKALLPKQQTMAKSMLVFLSVTTIPELKTKSNVTVQ